MFESSPLMSEKASSANRRRMVYLSFYQYTATKGNKKIKKSETVFCTKLTPACAWLHAVQADEEEQIQYVPISIE